MDIEQLTQEGLAVLRRNLDTYPPFDPTKPYQEKNEYFLEAFRIGKPLISDAGLVSPAEHYYRSMMDAIQDYEQQNAKLFNKGIVYVNLGIILTARGNLDEGIHYILLADKEDAPYLNPPHGVLDDRLWRQFEDHNVLPHLMSLNGNVNAALHFQVTEAFIMDFFGRMEVADRLLLETTIWTLYRNLEFNGKNSNEYTRGRLFSGLKDLCLLTEMLLRKKQIALGMVTTNTKIMLGDQPSRGQSKPGLLSNALAGHRIAYQPGLLTVSANSLQAFLNNLEQVLQAPLSPEIRRIYCLHLVRNFTGHHFDVSPHVASTNGKGLFDLYEETLTNIISAILFLAQDSLI